MKRKIVVVIIFFYVGIITLVVTNNYNYVLTSNLIRNTKTMSVDVTGSKSNVIDVLIGESVKYDVPIYIFQNDGSTYNYYYYSEDMDISGDEYISNVKENTQEQIRYLPFSNIKRQVYIRALDAIDLNELDNIEVSFKTDNSNVMSKIADELTSEGYRALYNPEQYVITVNIIVQNIVFIGLLFLLIMVATFHFFEQENKELFIKKMLGYKRRDLIIENYSSIFKYYIISVLISILLLGLYNFYTIKQLFAFSIYAFAYHLIFFIPVITLFLIVGHLNFRQSINSVLKAAKLPFLPIFANICKAVLVCVITVSLFGQIALFKQTLVQKENLVNFQNIEGYSTLRKTGNGNVTDEQYKQLYEMTNEHFQGQLMDANNSMVRVKSRYQEQCLSGPYDYCKLVYANDNYLNSIELLDENNNVMEFSSKTDNQVKVLVPYKYKYNEAAVFESIDLSNEIKDNVKVDFEYIADDQQIPSYLYNADATNVNITDPIIAIVDGDFTDQFFGSQIAGSDHYFINGSKNDISNILIDLGIDSNILVENKLVSITQQIEVINRILRNISTIVVLAIISYIALSSSIIGIYFERHRKELYIKYVCGYSKFDRYFGLLVSSVIVVTFGMLTTIMLHIKPLHILIAYLIWISVDLMIIKLLISNIEKKFNKEERDAEGK